MSFEMGTKEDPQVHTRHLVQVVERYNSSKHSIGSVKKHIL